ncbi:hypothetical protein NliqN6_5473 [Naganishia liquefaciens]|uniref:C2H2-type domain-containing protein n=1 Tax=Naganishia liquefaciens TaxID=104408 RepID=A0A8H3TWV5_9TREE|nr:hypothetical protein NliqN6_5473 [Naganishia liquefaciens]
MAPISRSSTSTADANNDPLDDQTRPSLPGFSSLFGQEEQGHRPNMSRNSSSSFPDLRTLKAPLTVAVLPGGGTRGSRDSGTASSSTTWSARSSVATGRSTSITDPSSAGFPNASLTSVSWSEDQKHHFPSDHSNPDPSFGIPHGFGLSHSIPRNEESRWSRPLETATLSDLAKRPSYANFEAELEARRSAAFSAAKAAAEAEEAERRQSDNATILSAERRRLMGSSVARHATELESIIGVRLPLPEPKPDFEGKSLPADEALLAARSRLLRYESYPFGSKNAEDDRPTVAANLTHSYQKQSAFPEKRGQGEWDANVINLTHSPNASTSAFIHPLSPPRKDFTDPLAFSSISSQRDMQFEEIVRKASVDLVKRSATSSLAGTPVGTVRPVLPLLDSNDGASSPAESSGLVSEAERANAREREQRQQNAVLAASKEVTGRSLGFDQQFVPSQAPISPNYLGFPLAANNQTTQPSQPLRHQHQAMDVDDDQRRSGPSSRNASGRKTSNAHTHVGGLAESDVEKDVVQLSRGSPSNRPNLIYSESLSTSLSETPHIGHLPQAGSYHQVPYQQSHIGGAGPTTSTNQAADLVMPYYDSPARHSVKPDGSPILPSVLRREYHPSLYRPPAHALPGPSHVQPASAQTLHHNRQRIPPQPEHYGRPPPQHPHGPWDSESGMPFAPQSSIPNRMLNSHTSLSINNATLPGPRYTCEHCGKSFSRPSSLKIHIYSHTGEKPYKCTWPDCTRSFSVQSNLKRHAKVHLENSGQQPPTGGSNIPQLGDLHHNALARITEGDQGPRSSSTTTYRRDFLTPQTGQPLPIGGTPEGYFDVRLQSRQAASHSPAPLARSDR